MIDPDCQLHGFKRNSKDVEISELRTQLSAAQAEIDKLRKLLKPFADHKSTWADYEAARDYLAQSAQGVEGKS